MFNDILAHSAVTTEDGKIIFPGDEPVPTFTPGDVPVCHNATFCENAPFYPDKFIKNALRLNTHLRVLSAVDGVINGEVNNKYN